MLDYIPGIDLGITESNIGIFLNVKVEIIPDKETSNKIVPSIVSFTNNEILIGEPAKKNIVKNYKNTINNVMFLIGKNFDVPSIQKEMKLLPYTIIKGEDNKPKIEVEYKKKKVKYTPEEILTFIFFKLKTNAEEYLKMEIDSVIISCSGYLNYVQRESINLACRIAGLHVLYFQQVSLSFLIGHSYSYHVNEYDKNLILHLGGGSLVVSIINRDYYLYEVNGIFGDNNIGGEYFDNRLVEYCINKIKEERGIDISNNKEILIRLKIACEKAKINLSQMEISTIALDDFYNGEDFNITITRSEFEDLCQEYFDQILPIIEQFLNNINLTKEQINNIFLIGSSSRIPKIKHIVTDYFQKEPNKIYSLQSEVIGTTLIGAIKANIDDEILDRIVPLDVCPLSLGIELDNGEMDFIIRKNNTIPLEVIKTCDFNVNNQNNIIIKVYQGEKRVAKENIFLDTVEIKNIIPNQEGIFRFEINFNLDIINDLRIKVRELNGEVINNVTIKMNYIINEERINKLIVKVKDIQEDIKRYSEKIKIKNELLSKVMILKNNENTILKKKAEEIILWIKSNLDASKTEYEEKLNFIKKINK